MAKSTKTLDERIKEVSEKIRKAASEVAAGQQYVQKWTAEHIAHEGQLALLRQMQAEEQGQGMAGMPEAPTTPANHAERRRAKKAGKTA